MPDLGDAAIALLADLVGIDSVNPTLVPGAAGEDEIIASLRGRLDAAGFSTTIIEAQGTTPRSSLVAVAPGPTTRPTLVLNGHVDTVGVSGMADPFGARIDGDRLLGRGAADMKGGLAALVVAAESLATSPSVRPVLALVADEEDANLGSEAVIAALPELGLRPDACLIAEPTDTSVCRTLRGFAVVRVAFHGRAAHSSQAALGVNAVTHLGRFLHAVERRAPELQAVGGDLMVTVVSGGESAFVVPDHAECLLEVRIHPEQAELDVVALARSLLPPDVDADVTLVAHREPWQIDEGGPASGLARRLDAALGAGTTFDAPYWMEAPLWQQVCPTVICGPSGGGLHAVDEWVDLRQVRAFTEALISALPDWGADAD